MTETHGLLINGEWRKTGKTFEVRAPFDNSLLAIASEASEEDVKEAVTSAETAFKKTKLTPSERYEILKKASEIISEKKDEFAKTLSLEAGKPIRDARLEVMRSASTLLNSAEEAKRIHGEEIPVSAAKGSENRISFTIREPIGIVCAISPFNFPMNLVCHKIGPAIAAGNSVVLKPASSTPLSAINLAKALIEAGLPKGLLNIVFGSGNTVGEWLLSDQRIGLYTFTGSPKVGKRIKEASGLRRVILELGSNSAAIVHNDADIKKAASACARAGFAYAGQICISLQRLLIHKDIMDKFLSEFIPIVTNLKVGDPIDESTDVGPLINEDAAKKAEEWINEAVKNGAKLLTGGKRKGSVVTPAVLIDVERTMRIVCFEAFAPVVSLIPYNTIDEAIDIVNDSEYGLQAGIFTKDINAAFKAIKGIKVGGIMINDTSLYRADMMPYGGVKNSGIGREGPRYAIEEMTDLKTVVINL